MDSSLWDEGWDPVVVGLFLLIFSDQTVEAVCHIYYIIFNLENELIFNQSCKLLGNWVGGTVFIVKKTFYLYQINEYIQKCVLYADELREKLLKSVRLVQIVGNTEKTPWGLM